MNRRIILLSLIIILATLLRVINLDTIPHGFHNDEASFLVNAIAISQTGKDEDGRFMPLFLHSYIDPKPALYSYLQIPFLAIIDNDIVAARLPGALFGILSILVFYFFCKRIDLSDDISLLATTLLAISPWHINLSRSTQEVMLSFFFTLLTLFLLTKLITMTGNTKMKIVIMITTVLMSALAFYSYHSAKIVLPIFVSCLFVFHYKRKNALACSLLIGMLLIALAGVIHFSSPSANARLKAVGIFSEIGPQLILEEQIREATGIAPTIILRFFHNKPVNYGIYITNNYLSHFSPNFLFYELGQPKRYQIPEHGLMYFVEIPLLMFGIYFAIRKYHKLSVLLFVLAISAPIPASLTTQEVPSMIRSFFLIIPLTLFLSIGIIQITKSLSRPASSILLILIVVGYIWNLSYFFNQFAIQQRHIQPWNRNVADQNMAKYISEHFNEYDQFVITQHSGQPYVYLVLERAISVPTVQASDLARQRSNFKLSNFQFIDNSCFLAPYENTLFVIHQNCEVPTNDGYSVIATATHEDGNDGYALVIWN